MAEVGGVRRRSAGGKIRDIIGVGCAGHRSPWRGLEKSPFL